MRVQPGRGLPTTAVLAVAIAFAGVLLGVWVGLDRLHLGRPVVDAPTVQLQAGTVLPRPKPLTAFVLIDQDGQELTESGLRGHWTFAAIGYTTCPDVCPMTMATFVALERRIAGSRTEAVPQFLFISVDPERDTPDRLAQYVRHFAPGFLGATGSDPALRALVSDLGGLYVRAEDPGSALGYTVDHSASIYLIDPQARLAAIFSTPHDPAMMAQDYAALAGGAASLSRSQ